MKNNLFFLFLFLLTSFNAALARTDGYHYQADVKGMVCAFCAYSVSRNISQLPGVDADTVDVDLSGGHVAFYSTEPVDEKTLVTLFSDSGFTISQLRQSAAVIVDSVIEETVTLKLEIDRDKIEQYSNMLEYLGNLAASNGSRLIIDAPAEDEDKLLKPLLMGRQQVIKVRFNNKKSNKIVIKLFTEKV